MAITLIGTIIKETRELFTPERYKEYLNKVSIFHNYSSINVLLIFSQKPNATIVAPFNTWKKSYGRTVSKGEKGIKILIPSLVENNGKKTLGYKEGYVFDITQTTGQDYVDSKKIYGNRDVINALRQNFKYSIYIGQNTTLKNTITIPKLDTDAKMLREIFNRYADLETEGYYGYEKDLLCDSITYVLCKHYGVDPVVEFYYLDSFKDVEYELLDDLLRLIQQKVIAVIDTLVI